VYCHTRVFYNYLIDEDSLNKTVDLYKQDTINLIEPNPIGCFAFLYRFDESQISNRGNLAFRTNSRKNRGHLHLNELIYARNIHADMKTNYIDNIIHEIPDPTTGEIFEFPERGIFNRYNWIQMSVSVFLKRSNSHFKLFDRIHESISEVYLTEEQVNKLTVPDSSQTIYS